jgi:putative salt-induced outer membrane protein YdiY
MKRIGCIALVRCLLALALTGGLLPLSHGQLVQGQEPQQINLDGPFLLPQPPPEDASVPADNFAPPSATAAPFQFQPIANPPPQNPQLNAPTQAPPTYSPPPYQPPQPTPAQQVAQPTPPPAEPVATPPAEKNDAPILVEEPGMTWWDAKVWDPWEGNVELGLNGTDGNSETFNVRFGVTAKHKTDTFVRSVQFTTIQKSANGITTANTALLDGRLEWPMPGSRWNYFIHGLMEYDEFKAFDARVSGDTGFGYEWIQNDSTTFITRSGLAFSHEMGGPDSTVHPELLFGGEYKHKFNATHSISFKADYFPDVTEFSDFRLNSQASWEIALAQAWGLSLKLSIIDRYDSTPQGARPNDLDYSTLLLWSF